MLLTVTTLRFVGFLNCSIMPDVYQHRDELSRFIGDEIARAIQEQRQLEQRYESLMNQRAEFKVFDCQTLITFLILEIELS